MCAPGVKAILPAGRRRPPVSLAAARLAASKGPACLPSVAHSPPPPSPPPAGRSSACWMHAGSPKQAALSLGPRYCRQYLSIQMQVGNKYPDDPVNIIPSGKPSRPLCPPSETNQDASRPRTAPAGCSCQAVPVRGLNCSSTAPSSPAPRPSPHLSHCFCSHRSTAVQSGHRRRAERLDGARRLHPHPQPEPAGPHSHRW